MTKIFRALQIYKKIRFFGFLDFWISSFFIYTDKSSAEEEKLAGLLQAKDKMATYGLTTRDAVKSVRSIWDF